MSGATQIRITQGFMSLHFMLVELIPPLKMGLKRLPLHAASILLSCFSMTTPIHQRQDAHTHTQTHTNKSPLQIKRAKGDLLW